MNESLSVGADEKLEDTRKAVTDEERAFLDYVWKFYKSNRKWPTRWECVDACGCKDSLYSIGNSLGGNIVREVLGFQNKHNIELTLLGALCTSIGEELFVALLKIIQYLMDEFESGNLPDELDYSDLAGSGELAMSVFSCQVEFRVLPSDGINHPPIFKFKISEDVDSLSNFESAHQYLFMFIFKGFYENLPFSHIDRQSSGLMFHTIQESELNRMQSECDFAEGNRMRYTAISVFCGRVLSWLIFTAFFLLLLVSTFPGGLSILPSPGWSSTLAKVIAVASVAFGVTAVALRKRTESMLSNVFHRALLLRLGEYVNRAKETRIKHTQGQF